MVILAYSPRSRIGDPGCFAGEGKNVEYLTIFFFRFGGRGPIGGDCLSLLKPGHVLRIEQKLNHPFLYNAPKRINYGVNIVMNEEGNL
jgi:hypothetical protein